MRPPIGGRGGGTLAPEAVEVGVDPPYQVSVGDDAIGEAVHALDPKPCVVLTDAHVGPLHAARLQDRLEGAGWPVLGVVEVPVGEASKSIETYADVTRRLARIGLTRDGVLLALGGGVVGDLGGFVAATYMRGVDLVMVPTSLLAMVDSAVGGKTGLDLPEGKNLLGAFVRPRLVAADTAMLRSLPDLEVSNGLAEVVKMGLLAGGPYLDDLALIPAARSGDADAMQTLILHAVRFKAGVVAEDELEGGLRAVLNYGHTVGHALEAAADFSLPHGSAVAVGMVAEADLSRRRFGTDLTALHKDLLRSAGLPLSSPGIDVGASLRAMSRDKKRSGVDGGTVHRFVLLRDVGRPVHGVPVHEDEVRRVVEAVTG